MCKLTTINSGSSGNTYLLQCGDEVLVLDCGMPFISVKKALNFNIRGIVGAVCTHEHGDHVKYSSEYVRAGIYVWRPYLSEKETDCKFIGGFTVTSFPLQHDVPCVGYLIKHNDLGKMLYVTDTEFLRYRFRDLNVILVEMNYSNEYIDRTAPKYKHSIQGHLEKQTTLGIIEANMNNDLRHVVLCHLSDDGSNESEFREAVREIVPGYVTVNVAKAGETIDLSEIPF